jgi:hypothetical protein
VKVQLFEKKDLDKVVTVCEFTAANDARTFTETGLTFATRRGADLADLLASMEKFAPKPGDTDKELQTKADDALRVLKNSPVTLEILYDGKPQEVVTDHCEKYTTNVLLRVAEPARGQKVTFRLTNNGKELYGAVLRLGGRNTIYQEEHDPAQCYMWLIDRDKSVTIKGFQVSELEDSPFKVESPTPSREGVVSYFHHGGTIDLVVFAGREKPDAVLKVAPEKAAIGRGLVLMPGEAVTTNLRALKIRLLRDPRPGDLGKRGLPLPGNGDKQTPAQKVEFHPSPLPVSSATIRFVSVTK